MLATTMLSVLLTLQPASFEPPESKPFEPAWAEFTTDSYGVVEILVYDDHEELVGALIAAPDGDGIHIEANFGDGHAMMELVPDSPDGNVLETDLEQSAAVGRVALMFALTLPPSEQMEATKQECMWIFAGIAAGCGGAAMFPPAGVATISGCLFGLGAALCKCAKYLPIDIC